MKKRQALIRICLFFVYLENQRTFVFIPPLNKQYYERKNGSTLLVLNGVIKKKGRAIEHSTGRIVLRGQTFLLKENSSEEPIDCMRAKNEKNPYNKTKLFTTVYIPVKTYDNLEEMQKNINKSRRLSTEELKELLSDI